MNPTFRDAFVAAFYLNQRVLRLLWMRDAVLRTNAMQSYIYPAIGAYLDLALICELPADASYFPWTILQGVVDDHRNYPDPLHNELPTVLVEHENAFNLAGAEMGLLVDRNAPLNVLITYCPYDLNDQIVWAHDAFAELLAGLENNAHDFLLILPGQEGNAQGSRYTPVAGWWNFLEWDAANATFQLLP